MEAEKYCLACKTTHKLLQLTNGWHCPIHHIEFTNKELNNAFTSLSKDPEYAEKGVSLPLKEGTKNDQDKIRVELLPIESLEEIAKVLTFGAKKYDAENWRKGISFKRVLGGIFRHLYAYARREDKDPESGISHLAHAGCGILFLLWYEQYRKEFDDRYSGGSL